MLLGEVCGKTLCQNKQHSLDKSKTVQNKIIKN